MSIIPVRVPANARPVLASERRMAAHRGHPIDPYPCPVCDLPLGDGVTVLILAGIEPESRKPAGWATGAAVAVHAACAGVPEEPAESESPATWAGGHALIVEFGDEELTARCQCGAHLGTGTPLTSLETFAQPWETHAMTVGR
jgi:hypothetical protein